jgi:hypothetical protein
VNTYIGTRSEREATVEVGGAPLNPRLDLRNHSPSGLEWGYAGSGPAQLALAILVDHFGDAPKALSLYQDFKFAVVARLPQEGWTLTSDQIQQAIESLHK